MLSPTELKNCQKWLDLMEHFAEYLKFLAIYCISSKKKNDTPLYYLLRQLILLQYIMVEFGDKQLLFDFLKSF